MGGRARQLRQFRHVELRVRRMPAPADHADADAADAFLQHDQAVAIGGGARNPVVGELDGRAHGRMP